jgi:hypothetical protein
MVLPRVRIAASHTTIRFVLSVLRFEIQYFNSREQPRQSRQCLDMSTSGVWTTVRNYLEEEKFKTYRFCTVFYSILFYLTEIE